MVEAQGGDASVLHDPESRNLGAPAATVPAPPAAAGSVADLDALALGYLAVDLGAGRRTIEDEVDPLAGLMLVKKPGEAVAPGEALAHLYTQKTDQIADFIARAQDAFTFADAAEPPASRLLDRYTKDGWMG